MRAPVIALLFACSLVAPAAQVPPAGLPQDPAARGGFNYVRVDMHATRDGTAVSDLRQDEIDLVEDGARQEVKDFERIERGPDGSPAVFVIFLDTLHTTIERSSNGRGPLVRLIDRVVGPDDMVAVMTPEMAATDMTFGRKAAVISNIMQREWLWGRRDRLTTADAKEDRYKYCYPKDNTAAELIARRREKQALDALEELVAFVQGVRPERKAILTVSDGWTLYTPNRTLGALKEGFAAALPKNPFGRRGAKDKERTSGTERAECEADRLALSALNDASRMRDITDAANRGNVTFYPVTPRGLGAVDPTDGRDTSSARRPDPAAMRDGADTLRALAQDTDGIALLSATDIEIGVARIASDLSSYYLVGYESGNTKMDGKFRAITVRARRPGVQVRVRKGYRGLSADEVMTRADRDTPGAAMANAAGGVAVNARAPFRVRSTAWTPGAAGATLWLVGEMDFATRRDLAWSNGATAEISVVSGTGERVASLQVPFTSTDGGFTVQLPVEKVLEPGDYAVRIRLVPEVGQALPLTELVRVTVPAVAMPLGEALLLRRGLSTGAHFIATADPRFQRSDRVRLELPTRLDGTATAQLLDRAGKPLPIPVTVTDRRDDAGGFRWIVVEAVLAPMAAGDYAVEVSLAGAKQVTPFRLVP
jgi:VWFA-related protein